MSDGTWVLLLQPRGNGIQIRLRLRQCDVWFEPRDDSEIPGVAH